MVPGNVAPREPRQSTWSLLDIRTKIEVCPKFNRMLLSLKHNPAYRIHVKLTNT
jgi:hypothetical protein